jgi:hypothetical protein
MPSRSPLLFDPDEVDHRPPGDGLKPGQPGKAWRTFGDQGWVFDCKTGTRCVVWRGGAAVTWLPGSR